MTLTDLRYLPPDPNDGEEVCPVATPIPGKPFQYTDCATPTDGGTLCDHHQETLTDTDIDWYLRHAA